VTLRGTLRVRERETLKVTLTHLRLDLWACCMCSMSDDGTKISRTFFFDTQVWSIKFFNAQFGKQL
jgi:hypothetical protein